MRANRIRPIAQGRASWLFAARLRMTARLLKIPATDDTFTGVIVERPNRLDAALRSGNMPGCSAEIAALGLRRAYSH